MKIANKRDPKDELIQHVLGYFINHNILKYCCGLAEIATNSTIGQLVRNKIPPLEFTQKLINALDNYDKEIIDGDGGYYDDDDYDPDTSDCSVAGFILTANTAAQQAQIDYLIAMGGLPTSIGCNPKTGNHITLITLTRDNMKMVLSPVVIKRKKKQP